MPRRNNRERDVATENARHLGDDYKFTRDPELEIQRAANRKRRAESARRQMVTVLQDWTQCVVPDCRLQSAGTIDGLPFPICFVHAALAWEFVEKHDTNPSLIQAREALGSRREMIRTEREAADRAELAEYRKDRAAGRIMGEIYYVRLGGLVKVGWSSDLDARLRSYGASAEILCHYPAARSDETELHRQLRPVLAKGREWYEDGDVIRMYIDEAIAKHGKPIVRPQWTQPKRVVAGKRHR